MMMAILSVKQASGGSLGTGAETQSIVFFNSDEIELLCSGEAIKGP